MSATIFVRMLSEFVNDGKIGIYKRNDRSCERQRDRFRVASVAITEYQSQEEQEQWIAVQETAFWEFIV